MCLESRRLVSDTQCNDEIDNDGDGKVDFDDTDCVDAYDTREQTATTQCNDGADNDGDGWIDNDDLDCFSGDEELVSRLQPATTATTTTMEVLIQMILDVCLPWTTMKAFDNVKTP